MKLNRIEYVLMNNPIRSAFQQHFEARRLVRMGGPMDGGKALELGCGRGVGVELIFKMFHAESVDAFDLDPRMIEKAKRRLSAYGSRVRLWVGDASDISAPDATYDAVFDFGIIHHVPEWRSVLTEIMRVLKPGGRFYGEEVLKPMIVHPFTQCFVRHPQDDRFDAATFSQELKNAGFESVSTEEFSGVFAWFTAHKANVA